jgi:N-acetylneuraminate synthase
MTVTTLPSFAPAPPAIDDGVGLECFRIGPHVIGEQTPALIVAEIGMNHNGDVDRALRLVDTAAEVGADFAKFALRDPSRFSLTEREMYQVFDHCTVRGITPLCTPFDLTSVRSLERYGIAGYKVASADLTNHALLDAMADTGKPLLVSTGMSTESDIVDAVSRLRAAHARYVLLHCNSTYPAPFKDVNLLYLDRLMDLGGGPVGYSSHERGINVCIAAVARGAKVIEKHFTLDRTLEGDDHRISLLPDEFAAMVAGIRQVEEALGTAAERLPTHGERMNRVRMSTRVAAPAHIVGATRHAFRFRRSWGLPVRYHDFESISGRATPDFLEFHLSHEDMEQAPDTVFDQPIDLDLVVRSPVLFAGGHILDLAARDPRHRARSVRELQRVIDVTREMRRYFTRAAIPRVVASLGGISSDAPADRADRVTMYERIASSLGELDTSGVELLALTMPPFPWHRGGQLYCNLFVDAADTADFCRFTGMRLCFDVAHSQLAANHTGRPLSDWIATLGLFIEHLHIADAAGVDGVGLEIGDGDVDFAALAARLAAEVPHAGFTPAVWEGHRNDGEGFWIALETLEQWF